ncbi:WXG100 family type VII secretion target [Streptomyces sp. NPDC021100]|uniref:WXG100 family type VII secretion target n=1 Tax=Streptomyces sp. NPDC021100 TaxID=3365114 RepID=UPI0037951E01
MEIKYGTVVEASNSVKSAANNIKSELDSLDARVEAQVAKWDGETRQAFHSRHKGWKTNVDDMHQTLLKISSLLMEATDGYQANDKRQAARFGH